ncbi:MAG: hypothetical protein ACXVH3_26685 [Solirubrobacteraceae bacterium]
MRLLRFLFPIVVVLLVVPAVAHGAAPQNAPNPGATAGGQSASEQMAPPKKSSGNGNCSAAALALNAFNPFSNCNAAAQAADGVGQLPGDIGGVAGSAAKALAGGVMDQVASWMVQAAQTVDDDVMKAATATSTPELSAPWYQQEFGYLAFFGAALAGIVALLGLLSASVRGDPHALGEIFYGILRAGLVTAMVISLTLLALKVADGISGDIARHMPAQFFSTLSSAWGTKGWGGLASSALAFVTALVEVIVAVLLWIELLLRDAAIYVAVLFFPFTLAMAIWPRLSDAHSKLVRVLGIFIVFKPVALIVMMTGANLLLGGVSSFGGVAPSVGTILAGLAILAMAAFAPWALMHLAGMDAGAMGSSGARRGGGRATPGTVDGASAGGALGGELFGGAITYGGGTAVMGGRTAAMAGMAAGAGGRGGELGRGGQARSSDSNGGGGGDGGRGILPGSVAAAAGLLPAGWQAARSAGSQLQSLADHGAARVHTAAGYGGSKPGGSLGPSGDGRRGGGPVFTPAGREGPPQLPSGGDVHPPDGGGGPPVENGEPPGAPPAGAGGASAPSPHLAPTSDEPIFPSASDQPFPPRQEES